MSLLQHPLPSVQAYVQAFSDAPLPVLRHTVRAFASLFGDELKMLYVDPAAQGQGYGRRSWETMIAHARQQGSQRIQTCIVARNHRVLNLYARLGFHFPPPLTTFHWVRPR